MARRDTNSRFTPDAVQNYQITPSASIVDKQAKYAPQVEESAELKATAQGLSKLAKGITDVNYVMEKKANDNALEAMAKTTKDNQDKWAEVSKNIDGMAKYNPYNKEAYKKLRAKANMESGLVELAKLEATCDDMGEEAFELKRQAIKDKVVSDMTAEGLDARHTADYLTKFHDTSEMLKRHYVEKKSERDYQIVQNQMITSTSKNFVTYGDGTINGWNKAVSELTTMANGLGMDDTKQYELLTKSINQYLIDNLDDIDAEDFMLMVGQTKINGKSLSDFDPNYLENTKLLLMKAKNTKFESDKLDFNIKKLQLEEASFKANKEMLKFMAEGNHTDTEFYNKLMEVIGDNNLEEVGFDFLREMATNKQTLLNLKTTTTNPETHNKLIQQYITGDLTQQGILDAMTKQELSASDAYNLFNAMESKNKEDFKEQLDALNHLYFNKTPVYDLGDKEREGLLQGVYKTISNSDMTYQQKVNELERIKGVAEFINEENEFNKSVNPKKLLTASYMKTLRFKDHNTREAQVALAQMGLFKNQLGWKDSNIKVTSAMNSSRTVTLSDGTIKKAPHTGTDIQTYQGRAIYSPYNVTVIASGYESSMGNYVLLQLNGGKGYIKMMHLQQAHLPKEGTEIKAGALLGHVGNTGHVTNKETGVLHVEFFDKQMKIKNPAEFKRKNW